MCRFTFYMGEEVSVADLVTRPKNSLIRQSTHARERPEPLNGDDFGLAYYTEGDPVPARFRSLTPAWSNANLDELARVTRSRCILAHVRAATGGAFNVSEVNCHPFRHGPFTFMHNGRIAQFLKIRRPLMERLSDEGFNAIRGTTDTEHLFGLIVEYLRGREENSSCALLADAMRRGIADLHEIVDAHNPGAHLYLNLVLCDGHRAVACRYSTDPDYIDSLYLHAGSELVCDAGGGARLEPQRGHRHAIIISSEPLEESRRWVEVERNHLVTVDEDLAVESSPLEFAAGNRSAGGPGQRRN